MNAVAKVQPRAALAMPEDDAIEVLRSSLYPGARRESVKLVLGWCKATGRDPMKKPVHIVPMWVKDPVTKQGAMQDVIMPGIGTYRTDAADTGEYVGKSEPEFGPDVSGEVGNVRMTYPRWCKITVQRLVSGKERSFTALEYWTENYATAGKDTSDPNAMWRKRPYGQLAKCAEAQALRMAFPDQTGNTNTMEEMEGKTFDGVTIDAQPEPAPRRPSPRQPATTLDQDLGGDAIPDFDAPPPPKADRLRKAANRIVELLAAVTDQDGYNALQENIAIGVERDKMRADRPELAAEVDAAERAALTRIVGEPVLEQAEAAE